MQVIGSEGMNEEAARFARSLVPHAGSATVVALSGDLGAGKTAFVKGVARALGVTEHVTSPTFVIMKIYPVREPAASNGAGPQKKHFGRLVHIDAYRLKGAHHLKVLGWEELLADSKNLICVEWPEQAASAILPDAIRVGFRYSGEDERTISYEGVYKNVEKPEAVGAA